MEKKFNEAYQIIKNILAEKQEDSVQKVMDWMQKNLTGYNWVGIYVMDHKTKTLHLGPYAGAPTDHKEIPFGKGICGQVAVSGKTHITGDVSAEANYIACSIETKSEIVVPIYRDNQLVAQIDIDSHLPDAFDEVDEIFLSEVNLLLAPFIV